MRHTLWMAILVLGTAACEDISSSDLLTSGMNATITGSAQGDGNTEVSAVIKAGGGLSNTYVDLEGDDALTVAVGTTSAPLSKRSLGVLHDYVATVAHEVPGDTFTVAFERSIDAGAPLNTFVLPDAFTVPAVAAAFNPTTDLTVNWSPTSAGDMTVMVSGSCILSWDGEVSGDPGTYVIPGSDIETIGDEPGTSCPLTITVRRTVGGQLDAGFGEGGVVQGRQERTAETTWSSGN